MTGSSARPVAFVTGARRGIGRAAALALAEEGFDLALLDMVAEAELDGVAAEAAALGARAVTLGGDIAALDTHERLVDEAFAAFGRLDALVNNAGVGAPVRGDLLTLAPENFDRVLGVNLRGTLFLTHAVVRAMLADGAPRRRAIVTVTSVSAEMASPDRADYCVSKAGLAMWSRALALRLAAEGVEVFEVRPGIVRTDMTAAVAERYDRLIEGGLVPARRWAEPEDVGRAIAALAAGRLPFATGSVVHVDGGLAIPRL